MREKSICFAFLFFAVSTALLSAEKPYWWDNPHKDDEFNMYERGSSTDCPDEQTAVKSAILAAKEMLVERIGIAPALKSAKIPPSPEFAIVNFDVADSSAARHGKTWSAWALIKYPQEEKKKLLGRWESSIASIETLKRDEVNIPVQFDLSLATADGRLSYREGEPVSFSVSTDTACYILLLDHQSDGTAILLFPNRYHTSGFMRKNEQVKIPLPSDKDFNLIVGPPFGDDRIEVIAATEKNELYDRFQGLLSDLHIGQDLVTSTRGLFVQSVDSAIASQDKGKLKWSKADLIISTWEGKK